ncbi:MAG: DEAD/DEAH box helicase, partial [Alphaproteobacteria bacterium]|nr:DEAD/DEAH box helicase [Alphaproteobacteria bacterium]
MGRLSRDPGAVHPFPALHPGQHHPRDLRPRARHHRGARARRQSLRPRSGVNQAGDLTGLLRERFGHLSFRPHQEDVCRAAAAGGDLLLVMPTGAGKSLCYQLPALARGGSSLVVSPLIALMEDQVAKLQASGLRVDRIHSGRSPAEMAQAAQRWMDGELELLYV